MVEDLECLTRRELLRGCLVSSMAFVFSPLITLTAEASDKYTGVSPKYNIKSYDWKPIDITDKVLEALKSKGISPTGNLYSPERIFEIRYHETHSQNSQWLMRTSIFATLASSDDIEEFSNSKFLGVDQNKTSPYLFDTKNKRIYDLWSEEDTPEGFPSYTYSFGEGLADNGSCAYSLGKELSIEERRKPGFSHIHPGKAVFANLEKSRKVVIQSNNPWRVSDIGISADGTKLLVEVFDPDKEGYHDVGWTSQPLDFTSIFDSDTLSHLHFDLGHVEDKTPDASKIILSTFNKSIVVGLGGYHIVDINTKKSMRLGPRGGTHKALISENGNFCALLNHGSSYNDSIRVFNFVNRKGFCIYNSSFGCKIHTFDSLKSIDKDGTIHTTHGTYKYKDGIYVLDLEGKKQPERGGIERLTNFERSPY